MTTRPGVRTCLHPYFRGAQHFDTVRNNLDKPGVINEAPGVTDHCAPVTSKDGRFMFSPPGEGVEVSSSTEGFTAKLGGEFVDHWKKIR